MSIANRLRSLFLHYCVPCAFTALVAFLLTVVIWSGFDSIPNPWNRVVKILCLLAYLPVFRWLFVDYPIWYERAQARAISLQLIGARQSQVDLEAQPLNLPPMLSMADLTFNPWELP